MNEKKDKIAPSQKPTLWQMLTSVLCAMFGVQKNKNRVRDFEQGDPKMFIILGIIMVTAFVLLVVLAVKLVMHFAAS